MIDYLKIQLTKDYEVHNLLDNSLLNFTRKVNEKTGEIINTNNKGIETTPKQIAHYKGLKFVVCDNGSITVSGSIHKYYNNGLHNFNDFGINEIQHVLKDFENNFNIIPEQCIIRSIELGINIVHELKTIDILQNCLLHTKRPFVSLIHSDEGRYIQCEHSQYWIKIYDKRKHYSKNYNITNEIMRFEIKWGTMEYFNKLGINTLKQLLDFDLINFKGRLLSVWQNVLLYDESVVKCNKKQLQFSNVRYWQNLSSENYKYHRKKYNLMLAENPNNMKIKFAELIEQKINELNVKTTQIDTLCIRSKRVVSQSKLCTITGYDISMQKDNSKMLSHSGLKYYKKNHYHIFKEIERKYLSTIWINSDEQTKIREIAHNIRSHNSNQQNKQERIYQPYQSNLLNQFGIAI